MKIIKVVLVGIINIFVNSFKNNDWYDFFARIIEYIGLILFSWNVRFILQYFFRPYSWWFFTSDQSLLEIFPRMTDTLMDIRLYTFEHPLSVHVALALIGWIIYRCIALPINIAHVIYKMKVLPEHFRRSHQQIIKRLVVPYSLTTLGHILILPAIIMSACLFYVSMNWASEHDEFIRAHESWIVITAIMLMGLPPLVGVARYVRMYFYDSFAPFFYATYATGLYESYAMGQEISVRYPEVFSARIAYAKAMILPLVITYVVAASNVGLIELLGLEGFRFLYFSLYIIYWQMMMPFTRERLFMYAFIFYKANIGCNYDRNWWPNYAERLTARFK